MSGPSFAIHDPDVVLTDLALAVLGTWLAWRLARTPTGGRVHSATRRSSITPRCLPDTAAFFRGCWQPKSIFSIVQREAFPRIAEYIPAGLIVHRKMTRK